MKKTVAIALSGGIDSAVSAWLLRKQGFKVIALTASFSKIDNYLGLNRYFSDKGMRQAKKIARILKINHYEVDFSNDFKKKVIDKFINEYLSGRTPNPCVLCNRYIKFSSLFKVSLDLGADYFATGHYATVYFDERQKTFLIKKAKDTEKDQSYFLYGVHKRVLPRLLFPLSSVTRKQAVNIAKRLKLPVDNKKGSQEICFLSSMDYRQFLRQFKFSSGDIVDLKGKIIGKHRGVPFYTVGQREGLGLSYKEPLYVCKIDKKRNRITVACKNDVMFKGLVAKDVKFFIKKRSSQCLAVAVKIRYNHIPIRSKLRFIKNNKVRVVFSKPQFGVSPGQAAVFYKDDILIGGGTIEKSF